MVTKSSKVVKAHNQLFIGCIPDCIPSGFQVGEFLWLLLS